MLSQIRQQLAQNWKDDSFNRSSTNANATSIMTSPMARQLNYQTEYNTSLLAQIESLEVENAGLRSSLAAVESLRADLTEGGREAEQRMGDLHRKLSTSSQMCDRLSRQCNELREANKQLETENLENAQGLNITREKHRDVLGHNLKLSARLQELEEQLQHSEAGRHWESSEEKARASALGSSLEKFTEEMGLAYSKISSLERELSQLSEEDMEVRRKHDRLLVRVETDESHKKALLEQISELTTELHQLKMRSNELELDRQKSLESSEIRQLEMSYADRAQQMAAEVAHRADEKWRRLEELVRARERELAVVEDDKERLERLVHNFEKKMRQAEEKWYEREKLVKSDLEYQLEQSSEAEAKLVAAASESRRAMESEQRRCEILSNNLITQQTEMTAHINTLQDGYNAKLLEANSARDEAHRMIQSLRRQLEQMEEDHHRDVVDLSNEKEGLIKKTNILKETIVARGERFANTLELLQTAVRQCVQETSEWKLKNSYLSGQLFKLLDVLRSLSVVPPAPAPVSGETRNNFSFDFTDLADATELDQVPIALRPIRLYGDEIRRSFVMFSQRVSSSSQTIGDLHGELKKTKVMLDENVFALDEERSELYSVKKLLANLKAQQGQQEREREAADRAHRDQLHVVEASRHAAHSRAEKAEERTLDLTRQITSLQAEIAKQSAELKAVRTSYGLETNKLEDKLGQNESSSEALKKELAELRRKYDEVMAENRKETEQRGRIREELKRCRDVAQDTAASFVVEKDKLQEQVSSMAKMINNYEVQLKQKESLLEVIKNQRTELASELQKMRAEAMPVGELYRAPAELSSYSPLSGDGSTFNRFSSGNRELSGALGRSLNAMQPTTARGYTFHSTDDMASRDALTGYSSKLKHLTQSIAQMDTQETSLRFDSSVNMNSNSNTMVAGSQSFRMPALDPDVSVDRSSLGYSRTIPRSGVTLDSAAKRRSPPSPTRNSVSSSSSTD